MSAPPLARLAEDQPVWVDDLPVTGRSTPRPAPVPDDFTHDLRFRGAVGGNGITVYCQPCHWGIWLDDGHTLADFIRLASMHGNAADVAVEVTSVLAALNGELLAANTPGGAS